MRNKLPLPTLQRINECIKYHPRTGKCVSLNGNKIYPNASGYLMIFIDKRLYCLHRLIWKIITGEDPGELCVDHINRDKLDHRKKNLRLCTISQNAQNSTAKKGTRSGRKGVRLGRPRKDGTPTYNAVIMAEGVSYSLGTYTDPDLAQIAYMKAALILHGDFACLT